MRAIYTYIYIYLLYIFRSLFFYLFLAAEIPKNSLAFAFVYLTAKKKSDDIAFDSRVRLASSACPPVRLSIYLTVHFGNFQSVAFVSFKMLGVKWAYALGLVMRPSLSARHV